MRPDQIAFQNGVPVLVFEFKFSKYQSVYPSQIIQAQAYCLILHQIGFKTDLLYYAIINCPPELKENKDRLKQVPRIILEDFRLEKDLSQEVFIYEYNFLGVTAYLFKFFPKIINCN